MNPSIVSWRPHIRLYASPGGCSPGSPWLYLYVSDKLSRTTNGVRRGEFPMRYFETVFMLRYIVVLVQFYTRDKLGFSYSHLFYSILLSIHKLFRLVSKVCSCILFLLEFTKFVCSKNNPKFPLLLTSQGIPDYRFIPSPSRDRLLRGIRCYLLFGVPRLASQFCYLPAILRQTFIIPVDLVLIRNILSWLFMCDSMTPTLIGIGVRIELLRHGRVGVPKWD